jgi:DNA-binding GntR family transcriptional regulator
VTLTRRTLESLIAACSARRATADKRQEIVRCAEKMVTAAQRERLDAYMAADQELDQVNHRSCRNFSTVKSVVPLTVHCWRCRYAYQHEGDITEGARTHMALAKGITSGEETAAAAGANQLMDYLERFARRIIDN